MSETLHLTLDTGRTHGVMVSPHTVKSTCVNVFALSKKKWGYSRLGWKRIATTHL